METYKLIIAIIAVLCWVIVEAYRDAEILNIHQYFTDHKSRVISRCAVGVIAATSVSLWVGVLTLFLFWLLFDLLLNIFRKDVDWDHMGTVAKSDKFFSKNIELYWLSKLFVFLASLIIIVILLRI
mgnify:CR=1 FL=1